MQKRVVLLVDFAWVQGSETRAKDKEVPVQADKKHRISTNRDRFEQIGLYPTFQDNTCIAMDRLGCSGRMGWF